MPIRNYLEALYRLWGPQHWWPAESPFEIVVGAYLTQNTAWTNVQQAMTNLRADGSLNLNGIRSLPLERLEQLIRPAGYFRQKAARLKTFAAFLDSNCGGDLARMFATPTSKLRDELLELNGVGPETADSILLYAAQHEVFVVDAYTRRIFERHALVSANATYDEIRALVETDLRDGPTNVLPGSATIVFRPSNMIEPGPGPAIEAPEHPIPPLHAPSTMSQIQRSPLAQRFNEFHALIVQTGKHHCLKSIPLCEGCPLQPLLPPEGPKHRAASKPL